MKSIVSDEALQNENKRFVFLRSSAAAYCECEGAHKERNYSDWLCFSNQITYSDLTQFLKEYF